MYRTELIHLLEKLTMLHDLADKKAYMALTIIGGLAIASPNYIKDVVISTNNIQPFWQCLSFILILSYLILSVMGLYFVINTLVPRTTSSDSSIVFWGFASSKKLPELQNEWNAQTEEELGNRLITEYHSNAIIANQKFKNSKFALYSAFFTIVTFFIIALSSLNFDKPDKKINSEATPSSFEKIDKKPELTDKKTTLNRNEEKQTIDQGENK